MSIVHSEAVGNCSELFEPYPLIKMSCVDVRRDDRIELQDSEAVRFRLSYAIPNQLSPMCNPLLSDETA